MIINSDKNHMNLFRSILSIWSKEETTFYPSLWRQNYILEAPSSLEWKKKISLNSHWRVINSNLFKTIQLDWATSSVQFLLLSGEKLISESLDCYFDKPNHNSLSAICDRIKNDSSISLNSHWQLSNYNLFKTLHLDWVPSSVQFLLLSGE